MSEATRLDWRFWLWHAVVPGLVFVVLATALELSSVDRHLAEVWFDFDADRWPAKDSWWAERVLHKGGRLFTGLVIVGALVVWLGSWRRPGWRRWRLAAGYLVLAMGLSTVSVTLLKHQTNLACPWDIFEYSGDRPYIRLFDPRPPELPCARCFPSGHASAGYAFFAFYFLAYGLRRQARVSLATALGLGAVYGFAQQVQGAHFISHDLWTAAICWFICLGSYALLRGGLRPALPMWPDTLFYELRTALAKRLPLSPAKTPDEPAEAKI